MPRPAGISLRGRDREPPAPVPDVAFNHDPSRPRTGHGPESMAVARPMATNLSHRAKPATSPGEPHEARGPEQKPTSRARSGSA